MEKQDIVAEGGGSEWQVCKIGLDSAIFLTSYLSKTSIRVIFESSLRQYCGSLMRIRMWIKVNANQRQLVYTPSSAPFLYSLHASIASVHGSPWLYIELLQLLNLPLMRIRVRILHFTLMLIRIRIPNTGLRVACNETSVFLCAYLY